MVDLGFLLITFFVFTSTLNEPTAMQLIVPNDKGSPTPTKKSGALTILPGENKLYYYEGDFTSEKLRSASIKDIRSIIIEKKLRTPPDDLCVIIKPSPRSNFRTVVDLLDEMTISMIKRYALVKISNAEESLIEIE